MEIGLLDKQELLALARLDFEKERFDQALVRLKQAQAKEGADPPDLWALLGSVYARLRLWAKAQDALNRFLALRPEALGERFQLGMTYFDAGEPAQALAVWHDVLRSEKLHPPALYYSALAQARLGRLSGALQYCETVISNSAEDNLFHGRAKELAEQLRADPRLHEGSGDGATTGAIAPPPNRSH